MRGTPIKTGLTRSNYRVNRTGPLEVEVSNATSYYMMVEEDTRPHVIAVQNARVLTNGTEFFGRRVNHPGTRGKHMLRDALVQGINS